MKTTAQEIVELYEQYEKEMNEYKYDKLNLFAGFIEFLKYYYVSPTDPDLGNTESSTSSHP